MAAGKRQTYDGRLSVRLGERVEADLASVAEQNGRTVSEEMRAAIIAHVERHLRARRRRVA